MTIEEQPPNSGDMHQTNRENAKGWQTWAEGSTIYNAETINISSADTGSDRRLEAIEFQPYLKSILTDEKYRECQDLYMPLRVERVKPKEKQDGERKESEQWNALEGLHHYASNHVLLMGKPGSGKSTVLRQLLWEEAQTALDALTRGGTDFKIPVLIELRDRKEEAIVNRIQTSLRRTRLDSRAIEEFLLEGRFLLLFDGLNEIPNSAIWSELQDFQHARDFRKNPRVFTTRELGVETGLGIETKLTILPLTELQIRAFVENHLPGRANGLLHQLKDRLRELAETPLLLKMLCDVVKDSPDGHLPTNRGELFRQEFARRYQAFKPKQGYVSEDSRRLTERLLQQLAFKMTQGQSPKEPELQISKDEAIQILQDFLQSQGETNSLTKASEYLEDLLEWDLLQVASDTTQLEFHHQLFQEYYAAEYLLQILSTLSHEQLRREYLNYLKWTEPIALMLAMVEEESQALQVVKLAMEVDLMLGARLAGEVQPAFQRQIVEWITDLEISELLTIELLGKTQLNLDIVKRNLLQFVDHDNSVVRSRAIEVLVQNSSEPPLELLLQALKDENFFVSCSAATLLENINTEQAVEKLLHALKDKKAHVLCHSLLALWRIGTEQAREGWNQFINYKDFDIHLLDKALQLIDDNGQVIEDLLEAVEDKDLRVYYKKIIMSPKGTISSIIEFEDDETAEAQRIFGEILRSTCSEQIVRKFQALIGVVA